MPNLSDIPALDALIGLAFVYFVLSLVLSSVTEAISAVCQVRWKKLDQGLRELFLESGGEQNEAEQLWSDFRTNDRIRALWKQTGRLGPRGPSYIPTRVLALALLDTLAPPLEVTTVAGGDAGPTDAEVAAAAQAAAAAKAAADAAVAKAAANPTDAQAAADAKAAAKSAAGQAVAAEAAASAQTAANARAAADAAGAKAAANPTDAQAAAQAKTAAAAAAAAAGNASAAQGKQMASNYDLVAQAQRAAGSVTSPLLRKWLLDALTQVDVDREKILGSLESSFDSVTNRVSGWYKRYSTIVVAVLAVVTAGALNVDSYAIGARLWQNDAVRSAVSSQAAGLTSASCPQSARQTGSAGKTGSTATTPTATGTPNSSKSRLSLAQAAQCVTSLTALGLPIGWAKENRPNTVWGDVGKGFGMIVTAFALMLGAPFWFDTLSKLARLRATGNPEGPPRAT